ncbi:MAG: PEP-CTERM sorting domain-containing protein [Verrucomicrobiia bacterium]
MKSTSKTSIAIMAGLAFSAVTSQAQLSLNFSSLSGSTIQFNGFADSFQFNASNSGYQWQISNETGGTGSAINLFGGVNNGPFSYGPISTAIVGPFTIDTANVLGPFGALSINDGLGVLPADYLTGSVNWIQIDTVDSIGGINAALVVNVTGLAYSGPNADLSTLVADGPASMNLSFQFSPGETLAQLSSGSGPYVTSYSGSVSVVPEPSSVAFILMGMGTLVGFRRLAQKGAI